MRSATLLASLFSFAWAAVALAADRPSGSQTVSVAGSQPAAKGAAEYFRQRPCRSVVCRQGYGAFLRSLCDVRAGRPVCLAHASRGSASDRHFGRGLDTGVGRSSHRVRTGDVVWCPPGIKHWHGATPTTAMTHVALTGTAGGKNVNWLEKVSDEQYRKQ